MFYLQVLKPTNAFFNRLSRLLKLTTAEDVALSLVLRRNSTKTEIVSLSKQHLKKRFLDLVQCYLDAGLCIAVLSQRRALSIMLTNTAKLIHQR